MSKAHHVTPHGRSSARRRAGGGSRSWPAWMRRDVDPVDREAAFWLTRRLELPCAENREVTDDPPSERSTPTRLRLAFVESTCPSSHCEREAMCQHWYATEQSAKDQCEVMWVGMGRVSCNFFFCILDVNYGICSPSYILKLSILPYNKVGRF
jgi:hypothetical protein